MCVMRILLIYITHVATDLSYRTQLSALRNKMRSWFSLLALLSFMVGGAEVMAGSGPSKEQHYR